MIKPGDRVRPRGNHLPATVLMVDGSEVIAVCDCGHRGSYALDTCEPYEPETCAVLEVSEVLP